MLAIAKGIATKPNFNTQGAQNSVTTEKVSDVKRIPALKTSSLIFELIYSAIAATERVSNERVSILLFLLLFNNDVFHAAKIQVSPVQTF